MENHFGMISIDWSLPDPMIKMEIIDINDNQRVERSVPLSKFSF